MNAISRRSALAVFGMGLSSLTTLSLSGCGATTHNGSAGSSEKKTSSAKTTSKKEDEFEQTDIGATITIPDQCELTVNSSEWLDEIRQDGPDVWWVYETDEADSSFFAIHATVKNLWTSTMSPLGNMSAGFTINDKYSFNPNSFYIKDGSTTDTIGPLQSAEVLIYFSVANEIKDQFEKAVLELTIYENTTDENGLPTYERTKELGAYAFTFA